MAGFFPVFFKQYWNCGVPSREHLRGWRLTSGIASAAVALSAPVLGAIADRSGCARAAADGYSRCSGQRRRRASRSSAGQWHGAATLYLAASLGFWGGIVFNDSLLLHVAEPREYDLVSGFGYAMGYLGGGPPFRDQRRMTLRPAWFGLANAARPSRYSFVMVGLWWLIFALPLAFSVARAGRRPHASRRPPPFGRVSASWRGLSARYAAIAPSSGFLAAYGCISTVSNTVIRWRSTTAVAGSRRRSSWRAASHPVRGVSGGAGLWMARPADRRAQGIFVGLAVYAPRHAVAYFISGRRATSTCSPS
jgi:UMF1 family MFS transporter